MSALLIIYKVIVATFFILHVNARERDQIESCVPRSPGIKSLVPIREIPGRYTVEVCSDTSESDSLLIRVKYVSDYKLPCNAKESQESLRLHSLVEKSLEVTPNCPGVCQIITLDLIANGCYEITAGFYVSHLAPFFNNQYTSYQYIEDSQNMQYFREQGPFVFIVHDHRIYIDMSWHSRRIPITSYTLKVCPSRDYNTDSNFEHCIPIDYCSKYDTNVIICYSEGPKSYAIEGPKVIVFQHTDVSWGLGVFRGLTTAIYKLDKDFDRNGSNVFDGQAHYLDSTPMEYEVTTLRSSEITSESEYTSGRSTSTALTQARTTTTLNLSKNHEYRNMTVESGSPSTCGVVRSDARRAIIICVVIVGFCL